MDGPEYSIQEICDRTGLPRRTIHFYTQQGLLPPPAGAGLGARYSDVHLQRLRLIPLLRRRGLRLDQIRERFQQSSLEELERLIDEPSIATPAPEMREAQNMPRAARAQTAYHHYPLSAGITLVVPAVLNSYDRQKVAALLEAAAKIFRENSLPSQPRLTKD